MKLRPAGSVVAVTLVVAAGVASWGFVVDLNSSGQIRHWALNPPDGRVPATSVNAATRSIIFHLDAAGWSVTNHTAELTAIRTAFDQWQAVSGTFLKFQEGATLSGTQDINSVDNVNTLFWTSKLFVNGGHDSISGALALTYVAAIVDGNVITDADTVFNGVQYRWITDINDTTTQAGFVEAVALHEVGHFIGLNHSPVGGATLLVVGDLGVNHQVGLATDEILAARALYGTAATASSVGRITGTVSIGAQPVFGAAVFVEDAAGTLMAGTLTTSNGVYQLPALAPGSYRVRTAPLDPQVTANYLVRGVDISNAYRGANTDYVPSADQVAVVTAGGTATVNFPVVAGGPMRIVRLLRPSPDLSAPSYNNKPVSIQPMGQTVYLGVLTPAPVTGREQLAITGDGITPTGPVEVRSRVVGSASLIAVPVWIDPHATPGLRSFRLEGTGAFAWAHGFLEILPPFPDVNFDGLDDRFQRQYWPRFTAPEAAPGADPDNDGFNNQREFTSGSSPVDPLSVKFAVESVRVTPQGATVRSQTAKGKRFQLFARDTIPGSPWQAVGNPVIAAGDVTDFSDPSATKSVRFYRVQLQ